MKNEQEKVIHFELDRLNGVSVTHGSHISNAFPVHFHSSYNLGIIEQGERISTYRGETAVLRKNDLFIIQPFEPHSCKSSGDSVHCYKIISFNLDAYYYFPKLKIDCPQLVDSVRKFHALAEYEKSSEKLVGLFNGIVGQLKFFSLVGSGIIINEDISLKIQLAKQFIEDNCSRNIQVQEMAEIACLSEFHFERFFHKCYGLSPYAYYLVCKMKKSQKLLVRQQSVIDTTYDVGFFDQSHFTRLFKKYIGVTPSRYLKDNKLDI